MPEGWKKDSEGSPVPAFLARIDLSLCAETVAKARPLEEEMAVAVERFKDVVHSLYNNTLRAMGIECEGHFSECTWERAKDLGKDLERCITQQWRDQDERNEANKVLAEQDRHAKLVQLEQHVNAARRLRKELGLADEGKP